MNGEINPLPIFHLQWAVKMFMKCSSIPLTRNYSTCQRILKYSMLSVVMLPLTSRPSAQAPPKNHLSYYPPSQKTMGVSPWMNATVGPSKARRAKEGASTDSTKERKDTTGVNPWTPHFLPWLNSSMGFSFCTGPWPSSVELSTSVDKHVGKFTTFSGVKPLA